MPSYYLQPEPFVRVGMANNGRLYAIFPYCPPVITVIKEQLMGMFGEIRLNSGSRRCWYVDPSHAIRIRELLTEYCPPCTERIERVYHFVARTPVQAGPTLDGLDLLQRAGWHGYTWQPRRWGINDLFEIVEAQMGDQQGTSTTNLCGSFVLRLRHRVGGTPVWESPYAYGIQVPAEERHVPTVTDITPPTASVHVHEESPAGTHASSANASALLLAPAGSTVRPVE
jgi:hypothetical protein